jgi:hypothetical protein
MANNTTKSSGERFRQLIEKIDEQEGSPPAKTEIPAAAPAYLPTGDKQIVPVRTKIDAAAPDLDEDTKRASAWEVFKNVAIIFSFVVNLILVLVVVVLVAFMFQIKRGVAEPLLGGLYNGFVAMDEARITATIPVNTTIPVNDKVTADFDLPLKQTTNVVLAQNTLITGALVTIQGGILQINNAPTTIVLPQGTVLPVILDLSVPVEQDIPVNLNIPVSIPVAVDIPLQQTELHQPFSDLRDLFAPYYLLVERLPSSWGELLLGR